MTESNVEMSRDESCYESWEIGVGDGGSRREAEREDGSWELEARS
jgi:hypothetical protein